jgi:peptidylprolyl isomerase
VIAHPPLLRVAAAALVLASCAPCLAADVIARVGEADVSTDELRAYVETLRPEERQALAKDPALLSQLVRIYLARQAVLKEARQKKWEEQPSVKVQLDLARDQALAELYLQSVSKPPEGFPSEAEVQAAYDANRGAFEVPRQYRVAQVFVSAPRGDAAAEEKGRKRVDAVVKRLREKGADFAAVARAESDDKESASRGGEIGWLAEAQMVAGIRKAVTSLAKDGVSEPMRLDDGWHVVKLLEVRSAATRPLAEVRGAIVAQLRDERSKANRQAYLAKLLERQPPAINELALSKLLAPAR